MLGTEISKLSSSIISQPITFRVYKSAIDYSSTAVTTVTKADSPMAYPAPQTSDAVKELLKVSMTTLPPDAGMTNDELRAKEQADREKQKKLQAQLAAVAKSEACVDDDGNVLSETECAAYEKEQQKKVADTKAENKVIKCESISGKVITDAAKCNEIVLADGNEKKAKANFLSCAGNIEKDISDCDGLKASWNAALSAYNKARENEKEVIVTGDSKSKGTTVVIIVIVCVIALLIIVFVVYIKNHHAFDDVYGTAGMASYNNPVYGGAAPAGADGGYLGAGNSTEYGAKPAKKKGGLVRQESMC